MPFFNEEASSNNVHGICSNGISKSLPKPPIFKNGFNGRAFYVPRYFPYYHSETQYILNMYKRDNWNALDKIAMINPYYFRCSYFQIPDNPDENNGKPMFHRKAVLYLTAFGLAIYLNSESIVRNLICYKTQNNRLLVDIKQPCFVSNLYVKSTEKINDLMQINLWSILFLRESFSCIEPILTKSDWSPLKEFCFLYRRPFKMCRFHYKDILDYCLAQIVSKPSLRFPQFLSELINCLNEEFSLLYFEEILICYKSSEIEEWVSIPRRLLRYAFYFDKDMRITCQIIRCIKIFQQNSFFFGPTKTSFDISYKYRLNLLRNNFCMKRCNADTSRVILDQDNCIALLLALLDEAKRFHHQIILDKLLDFIPFVLHDTHWILHFIVKAPCELSNYFSNLIEKVGNIIPNIVFILLKDSIIKHFNSETIPIHGIRDLNLKPNEDVTVEDALNNFVNLNINCLGISEKDINDCLYGSNCSSSLYKGRTKRNVVRLLTTTPSSRSSSSFSITSENAEMSKNSPGSSLESISLDCKTNIKSEIIHKPMKNGRNKNLNNIEDLTLVTDNDDNDIFDNVVKILQQEL